MKHLCIDIGNVLVNQNMEVFIKALSKQMNISKEEADQFINRIQKKQDLGISTIKSEIYTHFNIKSEYIMEDLIKAWNMVITPNHRAIQFFDDLADDLDLKVALVSNVGAEHIDRFHEILNRYALYNKAIHHFSCKVGARKPSTLYYKTFLDLYPEFKGAAYIDDLKENLEAGAALGLKPFHFDLSLHNNGDADTVKHLHDLKNLIVLNA